MSGIDEYYSNRNSIQDSIVNDMASTSQFFDYNAPDWQDRQGSFMAGLNSGWEGSKGMYYGFKGMLSDAMGNEEGKLESIDDMMEHSRRASVYGTGKVTDMFDIESFSDGKEYLKYGAGQVVPDLLMALGTVLSGGAVGAGAAAGMAGKRIATVAGRESLEAYAKKIMGKNLVIDGAETILDKQALNAMKMGIANTAKRDQYKNIWNAVERDFKTDMMKKYARRGAESANIAQSVIMSQGEAYQGTVEAGNPDAMKGMIFGSLAGLIEGYGENKILGGLFPNIAKTGTGKGAVMGFLNKLKKGTLKVGEGMVTEGATEAMQETIFEFNKALADDGWDVEKAFGEMANMEVLKRLANSFALGSIGGGMMGGGSATMGAIYDSHSAKAENAKLDAEEQQAKAITDQMEAEKQAMEQAQAQETEQGYQEFQKEEQLQEDLQTVEKDTTLMDLRNEFQGRKDKKIKEEELSVLFDEGDAWAEKNQEDKAQKDADYQAMEQERFEQDDLQRTQFDEETSKQEAIKAQEAKDVETSKILDVIKADKTTAKKSRDGINTFLNEKVQPLINQLDVVSEKTIRQLFAKHDISNIVKEKFSEKGGAPITVASVIKSFIMNAKKTVPVKIDGKVLAEPKKTKSPQKSISDDKTSPKPRPSINIKPIKTEDKAYFNQVNSKAHTKKTAEGLAFREQVKLDVKPIIAKVQNGIGLADRDARHELYNNPTDKKYGLTPREIITIKAHRDIDVGYKRSMGEMTDDDIAQKRTADKAVKEAKKIKDATVSKGKVKDIIITDVADLDMSEEVSAPAKKPKAKITQPVLKAKPKAKVKPVVKPKTEPKAKAKETVKEKVAEKVTEETSVGDHIAFLQQVNKDSKEAGRKVNDIMVTHKRPKDSTSIENLVKELFGKNIVWFADKSLGQSSRDGFVNKQDLDTIYLNFDGNKPILTTLGHEIFHTFDPKTKKDVDKLLGKLIKDGAIKGLNENYDLSDAGMREEVLADAFGMLLKDTSAMKEVAKTEEGRGLLAHMLEALERFVRGLKKKFDLLPANQKKFKEAYGDMFTDVDKAIKVMTDLAIKEVNKTTTAKKTKGDVGISESLAYIKDKDGKIDISFGKAMTAIKNFAFGDPVVQDALSNNPRVYKKEGEGTATPKEIKLDKKLPFMQEFHFGTQTNTAAWNSSLNEAYVLHNETMARIANNKGILKPFSEKTLLDDPADYKILDALLNKTLATGEKQSTTGLKPDIAEAYKANLDVTAMITKKMIDQLSVMQVHEKNKINDRLKLELGKKGYKKAQKKAKKQLEELGQDIDEKIEALTTMKLLPPAIFNNKHVVRFQTKDGLFAEDFDTEELADAFIRSLPEDAKGMPFTVTTNAIDRVTRHFDTIAEAEAYAEANLNTVVHNKNGQISVDKGYQDVTVDSLRDSSGLSVNRSRNLINDIVHESKKKVSAYTNRDGGFTANEVFDVAHNYLDKVQYDNQYSEIFKIIDKTPKELPNTVKFLKSQANTNLASGKDTLSSIAKKMQSAVWNFKMIFSPAKAINNFPHLVTRMAMVLAYDKKLNQSNGATAKRMAKSLKASKEVWSMFFKIGTKLKNTPDEQYQQLSDIVENSNKSAEWKHIAQQVLLTAKSDSLTEFNLKTVKDRKKNRGFWSILETAGNTPFQVSEIANRVAAATFYNDVLTSEGLPEFKNASLKKRTEWALHGNALTNFEFNKFNTPDMMKSGMGALSRPVIFPLMTFAFQSMSQFYALSLESSINEAGDVQVVKMLKEFTKQYGIMAVPLMFFAGMGEEPEDLISMITDGEVTYPEGFMGDVMHHGLLAEWTGLDMSSSVQQEIIPSPLKVVANLITGKEQKNVTVRQAKASLEFIEDPTWRKAIRALPNWAGRIFFHAYDSSQGEVRNAKGELIGDNRDDAMPLRYVRAFYELMGYNPTSRTNVYREKYGKRDHTERVNAHGKRLTRALLDAKKGGNQDGVRVAQAEIEDFNENRRIFNEANKKSQKLITSKSIKKLQSKIKKEKKARE